MNRLGFIQRLMAVLGVGGSLGLHSRHSDVPDPPASAPPYLSPLEEVNAVFHDAYGKSIVEGLDKLQRDINREDTRQLELEGELWRMQSPFYRARS